MKVMYVISVINVMKVISVMNVINVISVISVISVRLKVFWLKSWCSVASDSLVGGEERKPVAGFS
jgi:hypothetical protein